MPEAFSFAISLYFPAASLYFPTAHSSLTDIDSPMHFDSPQPVINDLEARILTIRDSL